MWKRDVDIEKPCPMDWKSMTPADKGRFCGECKKVVHDLSRGTEREARALLKENVNGDLCVRYVYDRHGKIFFAKDRPQDLVPASLLSRAKRAAAAAAVPFALAACSLDAPQQLNASKHVAPDPDTSEPAYPPDMEVNQGGAPPAPEEEDAGAHTDSGSDANADANTNADANGDADPDAGADADAGPILPPI
jgi:hypothetical protein